DLLNAGRSVAVIPLGSPIRGAQDQHSKCAAIDLCVDFTFLHCNCNQTIEEFAVCSELLIYTSPHVFRIVPNRSHGCTRIVALHQLILEMGSQRCLKTVTCPAFRGAPVPPAWCAFDRATPPVARHLLDHLLGRSEVI